MLEKTKIILQLQREFQRAVGKDVDTADERERNRLGETYLFKAIEEIVELRKNFPSAFTPEEKTSTAAEHANILDELADIDLFLANFSLVFRITPEQRLGAAIEKQRTNFLKLKSRRMGTLIEEMLRVPHGDTGPEVADHTSSRSITTGSGNLTPCYVFIGQNPAEGVRHGYPAWSDATDGSSRALLPLLESLKPAAYTSPLQDPLLVQNVRQAAYFTNVVKSTTAGNSTPDDVLTYFWVHPFLERELDILAIGNRHMRIIPMGRFAQDQLGVPGIPHPAYVLRGGMTQEAYASKVLEAMEVAATYDEYRNKAQAALVGA